MGKIEGMFLDLDTAEKLTNIEKTMERLKRDKNLTDKLLIAEKKRNGTLEQKIKANLETIEAFVIKSLNEYSKTEDIDKFIKNMNFLVKSINDEIETIVRRNSEAIYENKGGKR